jgi:hypothetical protein
VALSRDSAAAQKKVCVSTEGEYACILCCDDYSSNQLPHVKQAAFYREPLFFADAQTADPECHVNTYLGEKVASLQNWNGCADQSHLKCALDAIVRFQSRGAV